MEQQQLSTSTSTTSVSQGAEKPATVAFGAAMPGDIVRSPPRLSLNKTLSLGFDHFTPISLAGGPADGLAARATTKSSDEPSSWWRRTRMHMALLGLSIAVVNCYAQATFCIAIVEMVYPADYISKPGEVTHLLTNVTLSKLASETVTLQDHSCPIEFKYRDFYDSARFAVESEARTTSGSQQVDLSNRFQWDATQQGLLLGAFAFGTAPLQIVGGRLSEIYGSKWVLLAGCVGTAITNLAIPYIAQLSFPLLLANRVLMGVAQAGMEPGVMCLLADWLTPQEASLFISMSLFAICVGFFLGLLCSSLILGLGYGWPMAFYVSGGLNLAVAIVWHLYADSWPQASKYIGQHELDFIASERRQAAAKKRANNDLTGTHISGSPPLVAVQSHITIVPAVEPALVVGGCRAATNVDMLGERDDPVKAPWLNILSTRSVWAFIVCKISVRWCADVISNMMPTYLANVLHLSININGLFNSISQALFMLSAFVSGWLANEIFLADKSEAPLTAASKRRKTRVRKAFQSMASFGSAICLVLMTLYDCDIVFSMSMLLVLSCCLVMGSGGELQIPYDMTSRYPGTLHGMACTLSVSGWLAPPLIGLVLGEQPNSRLRWSIVWNSTAALTLVGGLAFVLFADSSPRDFDQKRAKKANKSAPTHNGAALEEDSRRAPLAEGYVNGALSSSSCESSPRAPRDNCAPHAMEVCKIGSSSSRATGAAGWPRRGQPESNWRQADIDPERANQAPEAEPLAEESTCRQRALAPESNFSGAPGSIGGEHSSKTIAPLVSGGALIEDHHQAASGASGGATMINGASRRETDAKWIVCPADGLTAGEASGAAFNERNVATTRPDLASARAHSSTLVANDAEQALAQAAHKPAGQHRASGGAGWPTRTSLPSLPDGAERAGDSRSVTHL